MTRTRLAFLIVGLGAVTASALVLFVAWRFLFWQNMRINTNANGGVSVDVRFLGEYQANATRLRITDLDTGLSVWDIRATDQFFPIWVIKLNPGLNSSNPNSSDRITVDVPAHSASFSLRPGGRYEISLWAIKNGLEVTRQGSFTLQARAPGA